MLILCGAGLIFTAHKQYNRTSSFRLFCFFLRKAFTYATEKKRSELLAAPAFVPGKLISLRKLARSDFPEYYEILKDERCTSLFFSSIEGLDPWYYMHYQLISQFFGERIVYSVIVNETGNIGGMIELIRDSCKTRGHISGLAHPQYWGQRLGLEAVKLASNIFFTTTNLETLHSYVAPDNHRAQTFHLKCGLEFSHISQEEASKNDLVFILRRQKKDLP